MALRLRWKIMLITVVPLVTLAFATLWIVNRSIARQATQTLHDELRRASAVLENVLTASEQSLAVTGQVIVQDPRFFSVLTIPGRHDDPQLRATVSGVARDFNAITQVDLFDILDAEGRLVAAVGRDVSIAQGRERLVRDALRGRAVTGVLVQPEAHHLVSVAPVIVGGRVVGALMLGTRIGGELAERLKQLTRSEVTFLSGSTITGSTLDDGRDRAAAITALDRTPTRSADRRLGAAMLEVRGPEHRYLTLVRPLPRALTAQDQRYVMQRAIDTETAFLRDIQTGLVELGVAAVLAALLAGFLIAERITLPVQRLVRGAEEMERGNFDFPLAVRSRDEIGLLAASFEDMRRRQREHIHSLQEVARIKSEFISVASHELRTPISVIRAYHELMLDQKLGVLTEQQTHALEATLQSVNTLTRIAEDATRVAHIESDRLVIHRADHDVAILIDQAIAMAQSLGVGRRVVLERDVEADRAHVDGPRLVQALAQLIGNGIRFTADGGRVCVRSRRDDGWLVIEVHDTGIGIEVSRQPHLFERSFLVRDSLHHHSSSTLEFDSAGLGLGLSIARGIAEAHDGRLTLKSAPGRGSTFTLSVPAEPAGERARAA